MSLTNFVDQVLTYLTDGGGSNENWDTNNHSPAPRLFRRDDRVDYDTSERIKQFDLLDGTVASVDSSPTRTNEPVGTEYDFRVRVGVGVRLEGVHEDAGGTVADDSDWRSFVDEAKRAILVERTYPAGTNMCELRIEEENSETPTTDREDFNNFRYEFTVWFEGYEDLP